MSETSRLQMARPKPVPPKRRVDEQSACVNALKICSLVLRRDTDASVADGKVDSHAPVVGRLGFGTDNDLAFLRELDGVADQVHEHLPQSQWITDKLARRTRGKCDRRVPSSFRVLSG